VVDVSDRGGIARYTTCLCSALRAEGVEVARAGPKRVGDAGLELHCIRWGPSVDMMGRLRLYGVRLGEVVPSAVALAGVVRRAHADVAHFQTEVVPGLDHLALRLLSRHTPVVLTVHDAVPQEGDARYADDQARRWRTADALIVHGQASRCFVEARAPGIPVHVVPVDLPLGQAAASRSEARTRLGLTDVPTALLFGQLRPYKGIGLLADAWPGVTTLLPDARLLVVGEAYESADLGKLARLGGVDLRTGFVDEADLDLWVAAADVLVLPYHMGSHSGVLHRGLAVGTPVLASPALAEEVHRTEAGRVVAMDAAAWTEALVDALGDDPIPAPVALDGQGTVTGTLDVYREVLERRALR